MQKNKALRIAVAGAVLAPALCLGLATVGEAQASHKNPCTVTALPPRDSHIAPAEYAKAIDYRVKLTCGPHARVSYQQVAWEYDPGAKRWHETRKTQYMYFGQDYGQATKYDNWRVGLPDTEGGPEDMYHQVKYWVNGSGPWSSYSKIVEITN